MGFGWSVSLMTSRVVDRCLNGREKKLFTSHKSRSGALDFSKLDLIGLVIGNHYLLATACGEKKKEEVLICILHCCILRIQINRWQFYPRQLINLGLNSAQKKSRCKFAFAAEVECIIYKLKYIFQNEIPEPVKPCHLYSRTTMTRNLHVNRRQPARWGRNRNISQNAITDLPIPISYNLYTRFWFRNWVSGSETKRRRRRRSDRFRSMVSKYKY